MRVTGPGCTRTSGDPTPSGPPRFPARSGADLRLIWPPVLLILMSSELQHLCGIHSPPWGCVGGSRNFRDAPGKDRSTRRQSHTQRLLGGTRTSPAWDGPEAVTRRHRAREAARVSMATSLLLWAPFKTTGSWNSVLMGLQVNTSQTAVKGETTQGQDAKAFWGSLP